MQSLENSINILKEKIEEIKQKKKIYEKELDSLLLSRNLIESEISKLREQSINLFKRVGSVKQDIIGKRFEAIKKELDSLVVIHQEIEKKQNESVTEEDKDKNQERIDFLKNIKTNWENSYKNINEKVTGFEGIGINTTSANVLISIGITVVT